MGSCLKMVLAGDVLTQHAQWLVSPNRQHGSGASVAVDAPLLVVGLLLFCMNVAVEAGQSIDPRKGAEMLSRTVRLLGTFGCWGRGNVCHHRVGLGYAILWTVNSET